MRCEECGHDLRAIPDGTPCTECGVVTPMDCRWPAPMPGVWRVLLGFAWPALAVMTLLGLVMLWGLLNSPNGIGSMIGPTTGIVVAVLVFLVAPLNTARRMQLLMQRLPRRVRMAPLLMLIPRIVAVPVLAGIATIPVMVAIAFGGCVVALMTLEGTGQSSSTAPAASVQTAPPPGNAGQKGTP
jgi:hypothetical protein